MPCLIAAVALGLKGVLVALMGSRLSALIDEAKFEEGPPPPEFGGHLGKDLAVPPSGTGDVPAGAAAPPADGMALTGSSGTACDVGAEFGEGDAGVGWGAFGISDNGLFTMAGA